VIVCHLHTTKDLLEPVQKALSAHAQDIFLKAASAGREQVQQTPMITFNIPDGIMPKFGI
jgi:hypothetical protein